MRSMVEGGGRAANPNPFDGLPGRSMPKCRQYLQDVPVWFLLASVDAASWRTTFSRNTDRDDDVITAQAADDWHSLVVWECETADGFALEGRLTNFLGSARLIESKPYG